MKIKSLIVAFLTVLFITTSCTFNKSNTKKTSKHPVIRLVGVKVTTEDNHNISLVDTIEKLERAFKNDTQKYNLELQLPMEKAIERKELVPWGWKKVPLGSNEYFCIHYIQEKIAEKLLEAVKEGLLTINIIDTEKITKAKATFIILKGNVTEIKRFEIEVEDGVWEKIKIQKTESV